MISKNGAVSKLSILISQSIVAKEQNESIHTHTGVVFLFVRDYIGLAVVVQYERSRARISAKRKKSSRFLLYSVNRTKVHA